MIPRVVLAGAGLAALALPLPSPTILGIGLTGAGLLALLAAWTTPGSAAPAVLIGISALSWVSSRHDGSLVRLVALALALAVVHSAAALAAVVPSSARVPAGLALRWAGWTAAATAAGVLVAAAPALLPPPPGSVLVTVAALGILLVAGIGMVLVLRGSPEHQDQPPAG
jgi:hypothetical protein